MTWEDQQHICAFGRFNQRMHEVNAELKAKAVRAMPFPEPRRLPTDRRRSWRARRRSVDPSSPPLTRPALPVRSSAQKMVEDLDEASNELIITDEDSVRYSVGETFVLVENDAAESMLEAQLEETRGEVEALEAEKKELAGAMAELKEKLYKKFGNSINLEE